MKLTQRTNLDPRVMRFCQQLGVTHASEIASHWLDENARGIVDAKKLAADQKTLAEHDLAIAVVLLPQAEGSQHWHIRTGEPQREQEIVEVCESLKILGDAGVEAVEYVFNLAAVHGTEVYPEGRGDAVVRRFEYDKWSHNSERPEWASTAAEVWDRIEWFLERALPVAEKAGVGLACHPDDPPVEHISGETRVTGSLEGMRKLLDLVPGEANGLNFCVGTVAERGIDVIAAIHEFGSRGRINHIHFRNVKGKIPNFNEAFLDDGDLDMAAVLRALHDVNYTGPVMPEHAPSVEGDSAYLCAAHDLGYTKALMAQLPSAA